MFGAAAHEIKNALGPLAMTLQLAERQLLAGQPIPPADLAFARAQVRRLSRLVDDLMDLTRADLGQLAIRPRDTDLLRGRHATRSRRFAAATRARDGRAARRRRCRSSIDATRIHQVLLNLLENAARYSPDGAPISVAISAPAAAVARVTVRDRGPGIAAGEQQRIFERFVRGEAAEGKGGLGIGLYLCRTIVERHGGAIGVDSTVGGGAASG